MARRDETVSVVAEWTSKLIGWFWTFLIAWDVVKVLARAWVFLYAGKGTQALGVLFWAGLPYIVIVGLYVAYLEWARPWVRQKLGLDED